MTLKQILAEIFTWWNGQTFGTRVHTWRNGEFVGTDELGNTYYRTKGGKIDPGIGFQRRWVIYNGPAELSRIPPGWRGWLANTYPFAPSEEKYVAREWEKPGLENLTGTPLAYRPQGSIMTPEKRPPATGDYAPWTPGD